MGLRAQKTLGFVDEHPPGKQKPVPGYAPKAKRGLLQAIPSQQQEKKSVRFEESFSGGPVQPSGQTGQFSGAEGAKRLLASFGRQSPGRTIPERRR